MNTPRARWSRQAGLSLIEVLLAMVLGLAVSAGIVGVFASVANQHRATLQWERMQEEGRYALSRLRTDLALAGAQYCNNGGGPAVAAGKLLVDGLRTPVMLARSPGPLPDLTTPMGSGAYPAAPAAPYGLPSFLAMRGYDCMASACMPVDPSALAKLPVMGRAVGNRVLGADVLTLRYVDPAAGWATGGSTVLGTDGSVEVAPGPGEPEFAFQPGDLAMLADCGGAWIYAADVQGRRVLPQAAGNYAAPAWAAGVRSAPRLFDFSRDYRTVTYYLKVVDGDGEGHITGALVRRLDGRDQELARGVERLDFSYGVLGADGMTRYLSAAEVDRSRRADCPPAAPGPLGDDPGCLWRAVQSIEASLLLDGEVPLATLSLDERRYAYIADQRTGERADPGAHALTPSAQGFSEAMLRREFDALVAVRSFDP